MEKIFILDASGYLYSSYFAIRNMTNRNGESTNALFGFVRSVLKLIKDFHPTHMLAVFDGPRNAKKREAIYKDYKAHRSAVPQDLPYQINWAHEFCTHIGIPYLNIPEVEADDTMGSVAVWAAQQNATAYICTSDKDMYQIVTDNILILNTRKDNQITGPKEVEQLYGVTPSKMRDLLALIGDTSDNVPGVSGIGPKTAASLLNQYGSLDAILESSEQNLEKKRVFIQENRDKAILSRELVTLDLAVNIPHAQEFYQLKPADIGRLIAFYNQMSFHSLIKELDHPKPSEIAPVKVESIEVEPSRQHLVDNENALSDLMQLLLNQKEIGFTLKMTHTNPFKGELVGVGLSISEGESWYLPLNGLLGTEKILASVKQLFNHSTIEFYAHNAKLALNILSKYGIYPQKINFDTMIASYVLNSHHRQHSLDALSLEYFGKVKTLDGDLLGKGKNALSMRDLPLETLCAQSGEELDLIHKLRKLFQKQLIERNLEGLFKNLELPLLQVLAKMEQHGIFVDTEYLKKMSVEIQKKIDSIKAKIFLMAGEEFNLNSPKQLSYILQEKLHIKLPKKTATGFSTNADILEEIKEFYPIAEEILEYRTLEKLRTTYIESLPNDLNPITQRIHCTFNQSVAATGRLSCQEPNLQNIPIRSEIGKTIREGFRPQKPDWIFLAADYSQIELRLLAHFSEDPTLIEAFAKGEDIHKATAAAILNIPIEQVTPLARHLAKAVNFGIIYGQQAYGLSRELKIDTKTAAEFIERYFQRYKKVKEYIDHCKALTRQTGKAVTFLGRERNIPEINSKNGQLRLFAERLAINTPLQGTAADLIKLAMLSIDREISTRKLQGFPVLQIHDELIFEIPENEASEFTHFVREAMQQVFQLKIPLIVDISLGKNWKEC